MAIEEYSVDVAYRIQGDVEISEIRSLTAFGSNMNLVAMISAAMWVKILYLKRYAKVILEEMMA